MKLDKKYFSLELIFILKDKISFIKETQKNSISLLISVINKILIILIFVYYLKTANIMRKLNSQ